MPPSSTPSPAAPAPPVPSTRSMNVHPNHLYEALVALGAFESGSPVIVTRNRDNPLCDVCAEGCRENNRVNPHLRNPQTPLIGDLRISLVESKPVALPRTFAFDPSLRCAHTVHVTCGHLDGSHQPNLITTKVECLECYRNGIDGFKHNFLAPTPATEKGVPT